jgi:hypothetical protein
VPPSEPGDAAGGPLHVSDSAPQLAGAAAAQGPRGWPSGEGGGGGGPSGDGEGEGSRDAGSGPGEDPSPAAGGPVPWHLPGEESSAGGYRDSGDYGDAAEGGSGSVDGDGKERHSHKRVGSVEREVLMGLLEGESPCLRR